jgi:hypothetical protein
VKKKSDEEEGRRVSVGQSEEEERRVLASQIHKPLGASEPLVASGDAGSLGPLRCQLAVEVMRALHRVSRWLGGCAHCLEEGVADLEEGVTALDLHGRTTWTCLEDLACELLCGARISRDGAGFGWCEVLCRTIGGGCRTVGPKSGFNFYFGSGLREGSQSLKWRVPLFI